jgi:hypothetical protein
VLGTSYQRNWKLGPKRCRNMYSRVLGYREKLFNGVVKVDFMCNVCEIFSWSQSYDDELQR